jgi:hypothetical protein
MARGVCGCRQRSIEIREDRPDPTNWAGALVLALWNCHLFGILVQQRLCCADDAVVSLVSLLLALVRTDLNPISAAVARWAHSILIGVKLSKLLGPHNMFEVYDCVCRATTCFSFATC